MKTNPKKTSWPSVMLRRSVPVPGADACTSMGIVLHPAGTQRTDAPCLLVASWSNE
jgi:hypothetical protein